ncbi:DUF445 family protein, partial [Escherichia sp. R-CC3]
DQGKSGAIKRMTDLIDKLKNDPEMAARADAVKSYLKEDEAFNRYLSELWGDLREWLKADINSEDSRVKPTPRYVRPTI